MTLKDHIQGQVTFEHYSDGSLWYRTSETNLLFPVPIEDIGTATFLSKDKALLFMRYIRKHLAALEAAKEEVK